MPDRFGDPAESVPPDEPAATPAEFHDKRCRNGWIDRDGDLAKFCPICKPHLAASERRRRMGLGDRK